MQAKSKLNNVTNLTNANGPTRAERERERERALLGTHADSNLLAYITAPRGNKNTAAEHQFTAVGDENAPFGHQDSAVRGYGAQGLHVSRGIESTSLLGNGQGLRFYRGEEEDSRFFAGDGLRDVRRDCRVGDGDVAAIPGGGNVGGGSGAEGSIGALQGMCGMCVHCMSVSIHI